MSANLIVNGSFEGGLFPWQTAGTVTSNAESFEGLASADLDPGIVVGGTAVISQAVRIPSEFSSLHVSWAMEEEGAGTSPQLEVQVRFQGSGPTFPVLRTDTVFLKAAADLVDAEGWETAFIATAAKPAGAVQARIRFIATAATVTDSDILIDNVVVTAE